MALSRPILELDLKFFLQIKIQSKFSFFALACGVIKVRFQQEKFISEQALIICFSTWGH